jgi:hypothetical protein
MEAFAGHPEALLKMLQGKYGAVPGGQVLDCSMDCSIAELDNSLDDADDDEEEDWLTPAQYELQRKQLAAPTEPPTKTRQVVEVLGEDLHTTEQYREFLESLYSDYNPKQMPKIGEMLLLWLGEEQRLVDQLTAKYPTFFAQPEI